MRPRRTPHAATRRPQAPEEDTQGVLDLVFNFRHQRDSKLCIIKGCNNKMPSSESYLCSVHSTSGRAADALKKQIEAEEEPWLAQYCSNKGCFCARAKGSDNTSCVGYSVVCSCTHSRRCRKRDIVIGNHQMYWTKASLPLLRVVVFGRGRLPELLRTHWQLLMLSQKMMCIFNFSLLGAKKKVDAQLRAKRLAIAAERAAAAGALGRPSSALASAASTAAEGKQLLQKLLGGKKDVCHNFNKPGGCARQHDCPFAHISAADFERAKVLADGDKKWTALDEQIDADYRAAVAAGKKKYAELCRDHSAGRRCRFGGDCRHVHVDPTTAEQLKKQPASAAFVAARKARFEAAVAEASKAAAASASLSSLSSLSAPASAATAPTAASGKQKHGWGGSCGSIANPVPANQPKEAYVGRDEKPKKPEGEEGGAADSGDDDDVDDGELRREKQRVQRDVALFPFDELVERSGFLDTMLGTSSNGSSNNQLRLFVAMLQTELNGLKDTVAKQQAVIERLEKKLEAK